MNKSPSTPLSSALQEILDTYYAPIKLPDDNRKGLIAALESLIRTRERAAVKAAFEVHHQQYPDCPPKLRQKAGL